MQTESVILITPYKGLFNDVLNSVVQMFRKVCSTSAGYYMGKNIYSTAFSRSLAKNSFLLFLSLFQTIIQQTICATKVTAHVMG